jgi:hypothetical protein
MQKTGSDLKRGNGFTATLALSLGANLVLTILVCYFAANSRPVVNLFGAPTFSNHEASLADARPSAPQQTAPEPGQRLRFSWSQLESADYPIYIANLRSIGCPERTLREIIKADVADLYAQKRKEQGLDDSGRLAGPWSREEETRVVAELFGDPIEGGTRSNELAAAREPGPVCLPMVFEDKALASLNLTDEQKADLDWVRGEFISEIGGLGQAPDDPAYLERWRKAQPKADSLLSGVIGRAGILELELARQ